MTSKEAVLELICEAKSVNRDDGRVCFLRKIIEKDLETLEILKKHYNVDSLIVSLGSFISFYIYKDDKDFKKVKEWLEKWNTLERKKPIVA